MGDVPQEPAAPAAPAAPDNVSENATTLKTRYPRRQDPYGMKFARGHRTFGQLKGRRPVKRSPARRA